MSTRQISALLSMNGVHPEVQMFVQDVMKEQQAAHEKEIRALRNTLADLSARQEQALRNFETTMASFDARLSKFLASPANEITRAKLIDLINSGEIK